MLSRDIVVVGAGVAGLTVAAELGSNMAVTLVDRLPAVGGVLGYEHPIVEELSQMVKRRHVEMLLGSTALRWYDNRLLIAGPRGIEWVSARRLVFCGGSRPSTAAELGIAGDRPAGILSATVATHLVEAGVRLGNTVAVVGASDWATRAVQTFHGQGVRIISILNDSELAPSAADERWSGWRAVAVQGSPRVTHLVIGNDRHRRRVACEAVILGQGLKPLRNIDGAVFGGRDVTYVQPIAEVISAREVVARARDGAARVQEQTGGKR
jgi:Pyridine nucleotide-disulphide oxidoreductase